MAASFFLVTFVHLVIDGCVWGWGSVYLFSVGSYFLCEKGKSRIILSRLEI